MHINNNLGALENQRWKQRRVFLTVRQVPTVLICLSDPIFHILFIIYRWIFQVVWPWKADILCANSRWREIELSMRYYLITRPSVTSQKNCLSWHHSHCTKFGNMRSPPHPPNTIWRSQEVISQCDTRYRAFSWTRVIVVVAYAKHVVYSLW